jgi:lactoylglutathione lyase
MRHLAYAILYVSDLDGSVRFFRDVLGVPLKFVDRGYAEFDTEGARLGLFDPTGLGALIGRDRPAPGPGAEVLFLVEDVDREAARLRDAGATILSGPVDRPWGHRTIHVAAPDGHVVELAQEIPRSEPRAAR